MIVATRPAMRFKPPITEGTMLRTDSGNCSCAKFAVPVIVLKTITGSVKRMLNFLYIKNAL